MSSAIPHAIAWFRAGEARLAGVFPPESDDIQHSMTSHGHGKDDACASQAWVMVMLDCNPPAVTCLCVCACACVHGCVWVIPGDSKARMFFEFY